MMFKTEDGKTTINGEGVFYIGREKHTMKEMKKKLKERLEKHPELKKNFKNKKVLKKLGVEE